MRNYLKVHGNIFRFYRIKRRLTQKEMSKILEVDQTTISRIENGERRPAPIHKRKLGEYMQITYDELAREFLKIASF